MNGDRLSAPGRTGDKTVRHLRDVDIVRRPRDVPTKRGQERFVAAAPFGSIEESSETDHCLHGIWHFDTDERLARDRSFDAHRMCGEREFEIVRKRDYL